MLSTESVALIFDASATVVNAVCVITVWAGRRSFAQRTELHLLDRRILILEKGPEWHEALKEEISKLNSRLIVAEQAPNWEVLDEIRKEMYAMKSQLATISGALPAYVKTIDLMHHWLVEHAK